MLYFSREAFPQMGIGSVLLPPNVQVALLGICWIDFKNIQLYVQNDF